MNYTIALTTEELNIIGAALGKMPYEAVATLVARLKQDAAAQEAAAANQIIATEEPAA